MSVETIVLLKKENLLPSSEWQTVLNENGLDLQMDSFNVFNHEGFIPCKLNGEDDAGFEYFLEPIDKSMFEESELRQIADRDYMVVLISRSDFRDFICAEMAAATLCAESDGLWLIDAEEQMFETASGAINRIKDRLPDYMLMLENMDDENDTSDDDQLDAQDMAENIQTILTLSQGIKSEFQLQIFVYVADEQTARLIEKNWHSTQISLDINSPDEDETQWLCLLQQTVDSLENIEQIAALCDFAFQLAEKYDGEVDGWEVPLDEVEPDYTAIAEELLTGVRDSFNSQVHYEPANWSDYVPEFKTPYDDLLKEAKTLGFELLFDVEDINVRETQGLETVMRIISHRETGIVAAVYAIPEYQLFLVEMECDFESGQSFSVTTTPEMAKFADYPMNKTVHIAQDTSLPEQFQMMIELIEQHQLSHPGDTPNIIHSIEQLAQSQTRIQNQKRAHHESIGWVTKEWIKRVSDMDDDETDIVYQEVQKLLKQL